MSLPPLVYFDTLPVSVAPCHAARGQRPSACRRVATFTSSRARAGGCQLSRIWRDTRAFSVNLTLSHTHAGNVTLYIFR